MTPEALLHPDNGGGWWIWIIIAALFAIGNLLLHRWVHRPPSARDDYCARVDEELDAVGVAFDGAWSRRSRRVDAALNEAGEGAASVVFLFPPEPAVLDDHRDDAA